MRLERVYIILLGVFAFLALAISPSLATGLIDVYNEKRILQFSVLILGSIFFAYLFTQNKLNLKQQNFYLWFFLFGLITVSMALSAYFSWALLEIGWYILLLQFALVSAYIYQQRSKKFERYVFVTLISFVALYSIRVAGDLITGFIDPNWPSWPNHMRSVIIFNGENFAKNGFLGFKNVRFFNHLQTWSLPVLIYGYIRYQSKLTISLRALLFGLISFFWMLAFAAGARGTLLSLLVAFIIVLFLFKTQSKEWLKQAALTCLVGFFLYIIFFHFLIPDGSGKALARTDSSRRLELWAVAWQAIKSNPVWGLGPMHMANVNGVNPITSPHNIYLLWMAEWGVPAFLVGGLIVLKSMGLWIRSALLKSSPLKIALTISFIAGMVNSGVSGLLRTPLSQLFFALILGWAVGVYYNDNNQSLWLKRKNPLIGFVKCVPLLLLSTFICVKVGLMVPHLEKNKEKFQYLNRYEKLNLHPTSYATIYPRFWEQGFIGIEQIEVPNQIQEER